MRLLLVLTLALPAAAQKIHELCATCHGETVRDFLTHPHSEKGLTCANCHGESVKHRTSQGHTEPDRVTYPQAIPALCGACHAGKGAPTILEQYSASKHGRLVLTQAKVRAPHCGTCHGVHEVRREKTMERQCRRCHTSLPASCSQTPPRAASVTCAACHAAHSLQMLTARR